MADAAHKRSVSFRFEPTLVRRLKQRAKLMGAGQTALAERYLDEGMRQDDHPLIYFREGASGRRAALLGTRLDVADAITTVRQNGGSATEAADYLEMPVERIEAAARYYGEYKDEIDAEIETAQETAERERELGIKGREALV